MQPPSAFPSFKLPSISRPILSRRKFMQTAGAAAVVATGYRLIPARFNAKAAALPQEPASFLGGTGKL